MFLTRKRNQKSVKDLSHVKCTTLAPGNLVPISTVRIVAGDDVSFNPSTFVQAMPMKAPLVNGFRICYDYFFVPDRLYNLDLALNFPNVTDKPEEVKFPLIFASKSPLISKAVSSTPNSIPSGASVADLINIGSTIVQPGSLLDYMGFPVGYLSTSDATNGEAFSALLPLGYIDIFLNYYANQEEPIAYTARFQDYGTYHSGSAGDVTTAVNGPAFGLEIETLIDLLKSVKTSSLPDSSIVSWINSYADGLPDGYSRADIPMTWEYLCSRGSIFQRCQRPYYLEAWLKTSGYNDALQTISVDTAEDGSQFISMRNISKTSHLQRWMDLAFSGGSRYSDYLNAQFDVPKFDNCYSPLFLGSDRKFLGSRVVYQTTGAGSSSSPLGSFAGQSSDGDSFKRRKYHFNESGYFFVLASLVPDTIYYRGLDPFLQDLTLADYYTPALDNIGMEPLMRVSLDALPSISGVKGANNRIDLAFTDVPRDSAVGYVPAWSKYDQVVSRVHGRMATELKYWSLVRDYSPFDGTLPEVVSFGETLTSNSSSLPPSILEALASMLYNARRKSVYTSYILPHLYNDVFADTSKTAQNFVLTFSCDMKVNRERGKVNVPTTL